MSHLHVAEHDGDPCTVCGKPLGADPWRTDKNFREIHGTTEASLQHEREQVPA